MTRLVVFAGMFLMASGGNSSAQGSAPATLTVQPSAKVSVVPKLPKAGANDKTPKADPKKDKAPAEPPAAPITTEIYADEATFDSAKYIGVFSGHVIVNDPRFNVQSDKLTIYIHKGENEGLEKAIAEGNVGVVRDRPAENGGPPTRAVGRAEKAIYTTKDGNVELTGNPRVQQGLNTHVSTSADTVMILNESGQLTTHGPSRTELRQEPKVEPTPKP